MKTSRLIIFLFLVILFTLSCSDDENSTEPTVVPECSTIDSISVTTGQELTFTWSPACKLLGWLIEPADSGADQWLVMLEGSNSLAPPVTYGVVPDGAREIHEPETLIPGSDYKIILFKWTGPGPQDGELIQMTTFTR